MSTKAKSAAPAVDNFTDLDELASAGEDGKTLQNYRNVAWAPPGAERDPNSMQGLPLVSAPWGRVLAALKAGKWVPSTIDDSVVPHRVLAIVKAPTEGKAVAMTRPADFGAPPAGLVPRR